MTELEKLSDKDFEKIENLICGTKAETLTEFEEKRPRLELSDKLNKYLCLLEKENKLLKSKIKNVYEVRQKAQSEIIIDLEKENEELKAQIEKMKCCKSEILQRIDESCIGALNEEVRVIFKKWELAE